MNAKPLHRLGLQEAAQAIRRGDISSEELTHALLERIAVRENAVEAFQWIDPARALELARRADERLRSGEAVGSLNGIPVGVKDIIDTQGIPTTLGSSIFAGRVPDRSAAVIQRIEAAGAFVLGKTVTSEFAFFTPGKTLNPWNPAHTPGGSSSGSAAAVAAGFVPAAIGTQTNGSVIRPAAFCGIVGYKPTAGLIPRTGIHPFSDSLDQVGVFGRSVPDVALMAAVLTRAWDDRPVALPGNAVISGEAAAAPRLPRLAAVRSPVWSQADVHAQGHLVEMVKRLSAAGAEVVERELPPAFEDAHRLLRTIMFGEAARVFEGLQRRCRERLSPPLNQLVDEGRRIPESAIAKALERRNDLVRALDEFMQGLDGVVTPPTTGEAPADLTWTGDPTFCTIWSLCGVPAVTVPTGSGPRDLPLGLQIVGPRLADDRTLSVARWCDERVGRGQRMVN
jgi:Asp-tRNA(Asn)/Glu-tRNA(Gln) amidotransferase A subunit family amidase